jgi:hypothetical protein
VFVERFDGSVGFIGGIFNVGVVVIGGDGDYSMGFVFLHGFEFLWDFNV